MNYKVIFLKPIWELRMQRNLKVLKSRMPFLGQQRRAVAFTSGDGGRRRNMPEVGGKGNEPNLWQAFSDHEWADLTDWGPKDSSYRVSCTFPPPLDPRPSLSEEGQYANVRQGRRAEWNPSEALQTFSQGRTSLTKGRGHDHRKENGHLRCREPWVGLESRGDFLQLRKLAAKP